MADNMSGSLITCPYCEHQFNCFSNAETFSMMKCPKCVQWFHVHIKLGATPTEYLSPDDFEQKVDQLPFGPDDFEDEAPDLEED